MVDAELTRQWNTHRQRHVHGRLDKPRRRHALRRQGHAQNECTAERLGLDQSVVYSGDTNFLTSTGVLTQSVNQDATATKLSLSPATSLYGQSVTFTATVMNASSPGSGTPTGTVTFYAGATPVGTETLGTGTATYSTSSLVLGSKSIGAVYNGDGNFLASTSPLSTETVNQDSSTTALAASPSAAPTAGQLVALTTTVDANSPGSGTPTGSVTLYVNAKSVGTFTLSDGSYSDVTPFASAGTYTIKASYSGDVNFKSSSVTLSLTIGDSSDLVTAPASSAAVLHVLGSFEQESSRENLISDLAFEQVSSTTRWNEEA